MKYIFISFSLSLLGFNSQSESDCLDFAIDALERAEAHRGSLFDDLEGAELMNFAYAQCESQS